MDTYDCTRDKDNMETSDGVDDDVLMLCDLVDEYKGKLNNMGAEMMEMTSVIDNLQAVIVNRICPCSMSTLPILLFTIGQCNTSRIR